MTNIAVALIVIMAVVSSSLLLITILMSENDDPRFTPHDYVLSGTVDGGDGTGSCRSVYSPEIGLANVYEFTYWIEGPGGRIEGHFGLMTDLDGHPNEEYYTFMGNDTVDGVPVEVWHRDESGVGYTLYIGPDCVVLKLHMTSSAMDVWGYIADGDR